MKISSAEQRAGDGPTISISAMGPPCAITNIHLGMAEPKVKIQGVADGQIRFAGLAAFGSKVVPLQESTPGLTRQSGSNGCNWVFDVAAYAATRGVELVAATQRWPKAMRALLPSLSPRPKQERIAGSPAARLP